MVRMLAGLLAIACLWITPLRAQTPSSRLDDIIARGTLRVGLTGDYLPFSSFDPATGKFNGFDVEMAEQLGQALGVKVEHVRTSWPKLSADFAADRFDIAMGGVSITLDRQKKGLFSIPIMREGKTPIARCADKDRFATVADIDRPGVRVIVNPGGTNERFARARISNAEIITHNDNVSIFDQIAAGHADVMMTDASETKYQQKLHPGVLCAVHPETPFDFAEKAYWLQRDVALKGFIDQWLHIMQETGSFRSVSSRWFE
ncbi:MAG: cyclohexadienyl dehydratase [Tardiphaga sp.]|jgi:cyclohexadienyl dehydratase|nr:cyclohexadienyl dehydratase [Tardiphaga sp.]